MQYDSVYKLVEENVNKSLVTRIILYKLLDIILLRSWHIHREIRRWARENKNSVHILDAGTGFGQNAYYLSRLNSNWNIQAVDTQEHQICDCNSFFLRLNRSNVVFTTANLSTFRQDNAYDLILSVNVMEHVKHDDVVFTNLYHSLKKGGMLLLSTPSIGSDDDFADSIKTFCNDNYRKGYTLENIKKQLKDIGFKKVKAHYSYGKPGQWSWKINIKYPFTLLKFSKAFIVLFPIYFLLTLPISLVLNFIDARTVHANGAGLIVKAWK